VQGNSPKRDIARLGELGILRGMLSGAISPKGDKSCSGEIPLTVFLKT